MPTSPQDILAKVKSFFAAPQGALPALPNTPLTPTQPTTLPSPQSILEGIRARSSSPSPFAAIKPQAPLGTPFTQAASKQAADVVVKALPKAAGAVEQNLLNIRDVFTGKLGLTPADLLQGVKQVGGTIADFGQAINEGVARAAKSAVIAIGGNQVAKNLGDSPLGDFAKVATGRKNLLDFSGAAPAPATGQELPTYQDIYKMAHDYATENKATPGEATSFGSLAVLGVMFADNPAVGPEGSGFKLSVKAVEDLTKLTDEGAIKTLLKAENPGLSAAQLEVLTPIFRDAKNTAQVKKAVTVIESLKKPEGLKTGYLSREVKKPPTPREIYEMVHGAGDIPDGMRVVPGEKVEVPPLTQAAARASEQNAAFDADIAKQAAEVAPEPIKPVEAKIEAPKVEVPKVETPVPEVPKPMPAEAIKAMPRRVQNLIEDARTPFKEEGQARTGYESAQDFASSIGNREIADIKDANQAVQKTTGVHNFGDASVAGLKGYRKDQALAQAFYNYVNKAPEFGGKLVPSASITYTAPAKRYAPNLLRAISQEDLPGPIADLLQKEFPKVSRRVLDSVANRLKDMRRTSDIEAMLNTLDRVSQNIADRKPRPPRTVGPIDRTQPVAVADILSPAEKDIYMDAITRNIEKKEDAVLAQQEYDALWENADQKIIDRYNELLLSKEILGEEVALHPGRKLVRHIERATGRLPEVTGKATKKSLADSTRTIPNSIYGRSGDDIAGELGFADTDAAEKGLEDFQAMKAQLDDIQQEIREIRPRARAAQQIQTLVKDVPVVLQQKAGEIDALASPDLVRKDYKDISGFKGQARDVYRNFKAVFGTYYDDIKKSILDPFDKSKGDAVDTVNAAGDRLQEQIVDKLGIKRGSKEDRIVMDFGEGRMSEEDLLKAVGSERSKDIRAAAAWFRQEYDSLINKLNEVRERIYPNQPDKLIQKRKDYFRHFQELSGDSIRGFYDAMFETPAGIDPALAGTSEFTKPKTKFLSFAQERLGKDSERSAIGGYIDYLPAYAYALHIDQHIGNFRYLRRKLAEVSPRPGTTEVLDEGGKKIVQKQQGINNFLEYLDDYANTLAGKTNPMDRYIQKVIPGGRRTIKVTGMINNRIKANTILGNISSAVAQAFNLPQGIASAKLYMLPGAKRTLAGIFAENTPMAESSFIKERYHQSMRDRFDIDWASHPIKAGTQRAKRFAAWTTQALDEVATKWMWNAHYDKGVAEGLADPVKYADDRTRSLVGGRGIGEKALLQESKIFNVFAPFSLEVGNAWSVIGDFAKEKDFGAIALLLVANYLMNEGAQKVRGSRVVFDPINALLEGGAQLADEMKAGNPGRGALKLGGRLAGETLSNIPLGQTFASIIPDQWVQDTTAYFTGAPIDKKEIFGNGDPSRFGATLLPVNGLADPLYRLLPPFGGVQLKKTKEAIESMLSGQVKTAAGKLSMKAPTDPVSVVQAVLFGKSSTLEAQQAFDMRDDLFQRIYRQTANRTELGLEAEQAWADIKKVKAAQGGAAAGAKLQEYATKNPDLATQIASVADQESKGLDGTDRLITMLGIKNGERAKFITETLKKMKDKNERVQWVQGLAQKGLLTGDVVDQITYLMAPQP